MDIWQTMNGSRLVTLEICYFLPDYPELLQTFLWQEYDIPPDFPRMMKLLEFWSQSIEGRVHSVQLVMAGHLVKPNARMVAFYGKLH